MFDKAALTALTQPQPELEKSLKLAKRLLIERKNKGENLGFDPADLPEHPEIVKMTKGEITQYAAHPRLDLFVDSNSPHPMEKFGCTICHAGQGSSTVVCACLAHADRCPPKEEWEKNHDWKSIHDLGLPDVPQPFQGSELPQVPSSGHGLDPLRQQGRSAEAAQGLQPRQGQRLLWLP